MERINLEKLNKKLLRLEEFLGYLETIRQQTKSKDDFVNNFQLHGLAERYLHLSIQCILDITHMIVKEVSQKRTHDNYEGVDVLERNSIILKEDAEVLKKMIGLRNILVHEYGEIDTEKIYDILQNNLTDIESFRKKVGKYIS